jgi:hypothetical protein
VAQRSDREQREVQRTDRAGQQARLVSGTEAGLIGGEHAAHRDPTSASRSPAKVGPATR